MDQLESDLIDVRNKCTKATQISLHCDIVICEWSDSLGQGSTIMTYQTEDQCQNAPHIEKKETPVSLRGNRQTCPLFLPES